MSIEKDKIKPRNPIYAFFLALFFSGLGQIYNGQVKKGIVFLFITLTIPIFIGFTRIGIFFIGFIFIGLIDLLFRFYVIFDAVKYAKNAKNYILKPCNSWYYYLLIIIGITTMNWFYDYSAVVGLKVYEIPNSSNEPTIKQGDRIVGDFCAFKKIKPNYGDIVIFKQKDSLNPWAFRIVGLPNDNLKIENNILEINGKKCKTSLIKETKCDIFNVNEFEVELPNGFKHKIYTFRDSLADKKNVLTEIKVPSNSYFLMGDNRDNAWDSRYFGVIKEEEILAKVVFGYFGKTLDRINIDLRNK